MSEVGNDYQEQEARRIARTTPLTLSYTRSVVRNFFAFGGTVFQYEKAKEAAKGDDVLLLDILFAVRTLCQKNA